MGKALIVCMLIAGCADQPTRHGNDALRVSSFAVLQAARDLDIVGVDLQDTVVAHLHLRTGMVTPEGWDGPTVGRELSFEVMDKVYPRFTSAGLTPLTLPLTGDPYLNTLVLDPFVAPLLSRWGVAFADHVRVAPPEVGYAMCTANIFNDEYYAPCIIKDVTYGPLSSCYDYWGDFGGHEMWSEKVVCDDPAASQAQRMCSHEGEGIVTPCGTTGPNGCATCRPLLTSTGGWTDCVNDSCMFVTSGGGGGCDGVFCQSVCRDDADCCSCGGYCGANGRCVF